MKNLNLMTILFLFGWAPFGHADNSKVYSGLGIKCVQSTGAESVSVYIGAPGEIYLTKDNQVTLRVFAKSFDAPLLNKGIRMDENLTKYKKKNLNWTFYDAFNFRYELQLEGNLFKKGKHKAKLLRQHQNEKLAEMAKYRQSFKLDCEVKIKNSDVHLPALTKKVFDQIMKQKQGDLISAGILGQASLYETSIYTIVDLVEDLDNDFGIKVSAADEKKWIAYAESVKFYSAYYDKEKPVVKKYAAYIAKLEKKEKKEVKDCIESFKEIYDYTDEDIKDYQENWSICSSDVFILTTNDGVLLSGMANRYNDNGTDEYDGHDGSTEFFDENLKSFFYKDMKTF